MKDRKQALPLRMVAARFISTDAQTGLTELDRITEHASRVIERRYWSLRLALGGTAFATTMTLLPGIFLTLGNAPGAPTVVIIGLACFSMMLLTILAWQVFQYGGVAASTPRPALYGNSDDPAVQNVERLFKLLQRESSPRAFFRTANGGRRYVDHRYFFGALRAAHIAQASTIRSAFFSPAGSWFDRELFLEADIDELIAKTKAEPSRAGAPRKYDYSNAIISLIEHPEVRAIDMTRKRGNQKLIVGLLEDWYRDRRLEVPSETQLSGYAKQILETIAKNRRP